jgi:RNA polymerase sigma-70 factor (ECF subfamily)
MTTPHSVPVEDLLRHRTFVRALARSLVHDDATADDVTQDTYVTALRNPPADMTTARSWLARVLRRTVIDRLRSGARRTRRERAVADAEARESTLDAVARMETHRRLVSAVMTLEEPFRTTIVLRFHDNLEPRDVARRMDVPVETVRSRTRRGLDRLRAALDAEHDGDRGAWCLPVLAVLAADAPGV